jgi:hypothetical protein
VAGGGRLELRARGRVCIEDGGMIDIGGCGYSGGYAVDGNDSASVRYAVGGEGMEGAGQQSGQCYNGGGGGGGSSSTLFGSTGGGRCC